MGRGGSQGTLQAREWLIERRSFDAALLLDAQSAGVR
jgi:hypothetical protein